MGSRLIWAVLGAWAAAGPVAAQERLRWTGDGCTYELRFSPAQHDRLALQNTVEAAYGSTSASLADLFLGPQTPQTAARLDVEALRARCGALTQRLEAMRLADLPGAPALREALVSHAREICRLQEAKARALKGEVAALRRYEPAGTCSRFADALEGRADFERTWRDMVQDSCRNNLDPKACEARAAQERAGPDGRERARVALVDFGWNNCVNARRPRTEDTLDRAAAAVRAEVGRLKPRRVNCETP